MFVRNFSFTILQRERPIYRPKEEFQSQDKCLKTLFFFGFNVKCHKKISGNIWTSGEKGVK